MELDLTVTPTPTIFRPNKKRNYIRRARATSTSPDPPIIAVSKATINTSTTYVPSIPSTTTTNITNTTSLLPTQSTSDSEPSAPSNLASILALRKKQSRPKRGLDIAELVPKVTSTDLASETAPPEDDETRDTAEQELAAVVNRFTHQTGQVLDVDKHMVAYIESEMEKRRVASTTTGDPSTTTNPTASSSTDPPSSSSTTTNNNSAFWQPTRPADRGATLGKLHEVDLGEENKLKNIHRTAEATRRLEDTNTTTTDDPQSSSKSRKRKRRNSQDIQRDKLVEEVLKESKLDLYDDAPSSSPHPSDEEGAADDRIAEKFRREFLDALMSRRRRRGNYQKTKKKDDAKKPRGPKLGGSRSARAAMRESQLAQGSGGVGGGSGNGSGSGVRR
ncbi:hepatocellular carcinoma-associated antigen 59-domain-containing protein [Tirmania nivea]|nr:hepatocellular carcinoma-associated antigen 59-domain-containing protein [Tirmania nivea]